MFLIFFFFFCSSNSMFFFFFFFFFFFVSAKDYRSSDLLRRLVMSLSRYLSSTPPLGVTLRVFNVPGAIVIREARPSSQHPRLDPCPDGVAGRGAQIARKIPTTSARHRQLAKARAVVVG